MSRAKCGHGILESSEEKRVRVGASLATQRCPWLCAEGGLGAHSKVRVPPAEPTHSFPQTGELAVEISLWGTDPSTPTLVIYGG